MMSTLTNITKYLYEPPSTPHTHTLTYPKTEKDAMMGLSRDTITYIYTRTNTRAAFEHSQTQA